MLIIDVTVYMQINKQQKSAAILPGSTVWFRPSSIPPEPVLRPHHPHMRHRHSTYNPSGLGMTPSGLDKHLSGQMSRLEQVGIDIVD